MSALLSFLEPYRNFRLKLVVRYESQVDILSEDWSGV